MITFTCGMGNGIARFATDAVTKNAKIKGKKMPKVFVYATLKDRKILESALDEPHGKKMTPALLRGYIETKEARDGKWWPTIERRRDQYGLDGDVFDVNDKELDRLDQWEDKYRREQHDTSEGPAWVYKLK